VDAVNDRALLTECEELCASLDDPQLRIVDCRFELLDPGAGRELYRKSHVPGSVFADLDRDLAAPVTAGSGRHPLPAAQALAALFGRLGISGSTRVVVYDQANGSIAARCWWLLRWLGHRNASLLNGGFARWQQLGLDTETGESSAPPAEFAPDPQGQLVLTTGEIEAAGDNCSVLQLVDARDSDRFAGISEPIDPVAGHIPGSISMPLTASLRADGSWKDALELRRLWEDALGAGFGRPWSTMCGSGVTACHLVVSGLLAGLPEPRVYVGSWSEWITDPERPIATDSA
jgi:thiosulfate/3-mercaptopyruvate sulfurtransferase